MDRTFNFASILIVGGIAALSDVPASAQTTQSASLSAAPAADRAQNPAGIRQERVTFRSGANTLIGRLFLPSDDRKGGKFPALVVTGAWMTVKEQMPTRYATEMARRGFAALAFDFTGWGESGGTRRQVEDPTQKIADIRAAASFLRTRPDINREEIGGLGICASSGYMVQAAAQDKEIRSVALVAPWLHDAQIVEATYGGKKGVAQLLAAGAEAEKSFQRTGKQVFVPAASKTDKTAIMFNVPYYTETDRGQIPAWRNQADPAFWSGWLTFDAQTAAPRLTQPFLMIHSEAAAIPQGAHQFFAAVTSPKSELWIPNVSQLDFYDRPAPVTQASDAVAAHFRKTLTERMFDKNGIDAMNEKAIDGVREFFAALEAGDIPRFLKIWAEDGVQEMPFAPGTFPRRLEGRAAIERQYGPLPAAYTGMKFPLRRLIATAEPGVILVEYDGSIGLKSGGRYDNKYVGVFEFNPTGKLQRFTEYFDPLTLANGFPGAAAMAMSDAQRIEAMVQNLGKAADARDWNGVGAIFADEVDLDYTSVAGGSPAKVKRGDIVAGWTTGLTRYAQTKHHFGDVKVKADGDTATATFTGQATHLKANGERWSCGGDYIYHFVRTPDGWRAISAKFDMKWEQGIR